MSQEEAGILTGVGNSTEPRGGGRGREACSPQGKLFILAQGNHAELTFSLFGTPACGMMSPTFKVGLLTSINTI